jgi:hypothetical protein
MRGFNLGRQVRGALSNARNYLEDKGIYKGETPEETVEQVEGEFTSAIDDLMADRPDLTSDEVDPEGNLSEQQNFRKGKKGRKYANLAPASGASILTQRPPS